MFSTGQLIFAGIFFVAFVIIIFFSYRKDIKLHRKYYKGTKYILLAFFIFLGILFALKYFLRY